MPDLYTSNVTSYCSYVALSSYDWTSIAAPYHPCYGISLQFNPVVYCIYTGFHVLCLWICFVLLLKIVLTFQSWNTLYFWSLTLTALGTSLVQIIGDIPILADISTSVATATITSVAYTLSWVAMVSGFSLVLYSRLHLILPNPKLVRIVLYVVIADGIIVQAPTVILSCVFPRIGAATFVKSAHFFTYYEVVLSLQEAVLSTLYIYLFTRFMRPADSQKPQEVRKVLYLLVAAEITIIACDLVNNTLLYLQMYFARKLVYAFLFSIKLRVEFAVLNRLAALGKHRVQLHDVSVKDRARGIRSLFSTRSEHHEDSIDTNNQIMRMPGVREGGGSAPTPGSSLGSPHAVNIEGKRREERDSMEEIERRYLGRFEIVDIV